MTFNLDNNIEAKVRPKSTDTSTTAKKIKILEGFTISTAYNFAADSLNLSPISFSGHTTLFKDKLNITFGGTLDPYVTELRDSISNGQLFKYKIPINKYTFQSGKFPTLISGNISASASLKPGSISSAGTSTYAWYYLAVHHSRTICQISVAEQRPQCLRRLQRSLEFIS